MTKALPVGYVTILQAAEVLLPSLYAGVPDLPSVTALREQHGMDVRDGPATDRAIGEIWKAVDAGAMIPMAIGGRRRRIVKLNLTLTKQVPNLRSPRGRGFSFLRPSNPAFHELAGYFGHDISNVSLVFRETEIQKLGRRLMRLRRAALKSEGQRKPRGRPSRQQQVLSIVREIIEGGKYSPLKGMKALTQLVNRRLHSPISEDTATRVLDRLYEETQDRRFQRVPKKREAAARHTARRKHSRRLAGNTSRP